MNSSDQPITTTTTSTSSSSSNRNQNQNKQKKEKENVNHRPNKETSKANNKKDDTKQNKVSQTNVVMFLICDMNFKLTNEL